MTSMTRMVHNILRLRPLLVSSEGIRGSRVASHPNPVADATRPYPESPTDTNSCLGKSLGGERQPLERLGVHTSPAAHPLIGMVAPLGLRLLYSIELEPVEDPDSVEPDDDQPVPPNPGQPVNPGWDVGRDPTEFES